MKPNRPGQWYRVVAPNFCCGVNVINGVIVDAAPILQWASRLNAKGESQ